MAKSRLIVGISGASGAIYGIRLLEMLKRLGVESHLVISSAAAMTIAYETDYKLAEVRERADCWYDNGDLGAALASGSFRTLGMVIAPCSVRSVAEIASGMAGSLLTRAADVVLKERKPLVLMLRETPLHQVHLRNLLTVAELGAIVAPPVPAFYARPQSIEQMVEHSLGRVLDLFGLDSGTVARWGETGRRGGAGVKRRR